MHYLPDAKGEVLALSATVKWKSSGADKQLTPRCPTSPKMAGLDARSGQGVLRSQGVDRRRRLPRNSSKDTALRARKIQLAATATSLNLMHCQIPCSTTPNAQNTGTQGPSPPACLFWCQPTSVGTMPAQRVSSSGAHDPLRSRERPSGSHPSADKGHGICCYPHRGLPTCNATNQRPSLVPKSIQPGRIGLFHRSSHSASSDASNLP
jgi:hypothetical protein